MSFLTRMREILTMDILPSKQPVLKNLQLTDEEYEKVMQICVLWYTGECELVSVTDISESAVFQIATFDILSITDSYIERVFRSTAHDRTYTRLKQVYLHICIVIGNDKMKYMINTLCDSIMSLNRRARIVVRNNDTGKLTEEIIKSDVSEIFEKYPFLALIPFLNLIAVTHLNTKLVNTINKSNIK